MKDVPSALVDTIHSISVHNSVARIVFVRLDASNQAQPVFELCIPVSQIGSVMKALSSIRQNQG